MVVLNLGVGFDFGARKNCVVEMELCLVLVKFRIFSRCWISHKLFDSLQFGIELFLHGKSILIPYNLVPRK